MGAARIRRLTLTNFRSYRAAQIEVGAGPIVLVGPNGAGKTNLIEAISFLTPGRGLRRATFEDVAFSEGDGSWAVSADVDGALGLASLGTGIEPPASEDAVISRKCRIDREPVASAAAFAEHLRVVWLVPAMDGLFTGAASERRRFLDRLALALDAEHMTRVNALERALRSRNRLLEDARPDPHWLDAIEHETAELAVAVTALRVETVGRLQARRAAPYRSPRHSRGQANCRRRGLDRRTEGAAHWPHSGPRGPPCGNVGLRAGAAAGRGYRSSRPRAAGRALRGTRHPRRASLDNRRRCCRLRRHRRQ